MLGAGSLLFVPVCVFCRPQTAESEDKGCGVLTIDHYCFPYKLHGQHSRVYHEGQPQAPFEGPVKPFQTSTRQTVVVWGC